MVPSLVIYLGGLALLVGLLLLLVFVLLPLLLALWETLIIRRHGSHRQQRFVKSRLCVGQVWHTRFHPKRHAFSYPIFMFALDLEESESASSFGTSFMLWPLVRFQSRHHLKNGEGTITTNNNENNNGSHPHDSSLAQRVLNLVATKTKNKFQPTLATHQILLLTHLEYFGYNFNPVSFYYIVNKSTNSLEAMVGEVSNTPWTEMYCYVLHPDSVDRVQCRQEEGTVGSSSSSSSSPSPSSSNNNNKKTQHEYRFPKEFHVSPFMEMNYWYDWSFQGIPTTADQFVVVNSLRRRGSSSTEDETLDFTAKLRMTNVVPITPFAVAWQMIRFPVFCMLIQIWIHYQAAWLFFKGVVYIPHPDGSETAASKTIATIMTPFFSIRDYLQEKSSRRSSARQTSKHE